MFVCVSTASLNTNGTIKINTFNSFLLSILSRYFFNTPRILKEIMFHSFLVSVYVNTTLVATLACVHLMR